jgi:Tfp pilus assembly PilM family ATPase
MSSALGISFSDNACHAIVMHSSIEKYTWDNQIKLNHDFDDTQKLTDMILELKSNYQKKMCVIAGIPSHKVITREIEVSIALSDPDILQYIIIHAHKLLGYGADDLSFDFEKHQCDDPNRNRIHIVATRKILVQKIMTSFRAAKMPLHAIDVDAHALARFNRFTMQNQFEFKEFEIAAGLCLWRAS